MPSLARRAFAECLGTAFLLAAVVGSTTVTIACSLSNTFAGIAPDGVVPFVAAQLEHDPEKCEAVFRKDHAQTKS
ncbi:hypothetical protein MTX26_32035 [Bradyrhizobium sp. ISRA443]|uniref:hypothetical protein n=1 Tax=unclassified Bradyrhizobium TaxID=2631580 RepID=UPI002479BDEE|nr:MULTISPECIES: hypothetical protein [unclassified Bradyrhizobium]WGR94122.1 hypothetical protein MTX20_07060 [Bradyrhizobium sp. ISRA435]WGR98782.1 hypothetical protein MTX23_32015 [Bradyrhizobium sp. ISRA436]WGS05673.1 hypothetical protein MTX18_32035 [Bradyrhizobium sp. ISRA437]WGS12559.1 hypothetical protein MTX26_32035 [Bradyrhizobium sp. ISRA443]